MTAQRIHTGLAAAVVSLLMFGSPAAQGSDTAPPSTPTPDELTIITSDKLTYDAERQFIVFENNVVVRDPSLKMTADHMTVNLGEDQEVKSILAVGNVVLTQEDRQAWAQRASYDLDEGIIVLEGEPRVMRGRDLLAGDRITFWRDDQRMVCEPHARLVIQPDSEGIRNGLKREH